jgi:putative ABC transport system ATP-binding protein
MRLSHVSHQFDGQLVLNDIELHVSPGECVAIVGPSGSGKSTLLYILGLLRKPDQGAFLMNERDVFELDEEQRRLLRLHEVGFVFQQAHLIPYLTVLEQLELIQEKKKLDAKQLLTDLGLGHRLHHLPATCQEVKSNAWPSLGPSSIPRNSFWQMNRRRVWIMRMDVL